MDPDKLLALLGRMEYYLSRGIQVQVADREHAPLVLVQVNNTEDHVLVPEITALALEIYHANLS